VPQCGRRSSAHEGYAGESGGCCAGRRWGEVRFFPVKMSLHFVVLLEETC
jgi:hypothetical protein